MLVAAPNRLPKQPTKPYIRPERKQERKRPMTIALGIRTPDGIVLCSDSQLTVPQQMKYYDQKIRAFWNGEDWSLALTYSGDPERMQRICESMEKSLRSALEIDEHYITGAS
jgi:20S proteasome alpha/beta subunit